MKPADLRTASFRGLKFAVRSIGGSMGRRVDVHEYPGLDQVTSDDLGRARRVIRLEAVITGDDWQERADALLWELEQPGPGELVHPEGNRVQVVPT